MAIASVAAAASGDNAIVPATAGKKIRVERFQLFNGVATAQNVKWRSGTTDLTGLLYGPLAVGRLAEDRASKGEWIFETVAGQALNLNLSAATAVGGYVVYELE